IQGFQLDNIEFVFSQNPFERQFKIFGNKARYVVGIFAEKIEKSILQFQFIVDLNLVDGSVMVKIGRQTAEVEIMLFGIHAEQRHVASQGMQRLAQICNCNG